MTVEWVKGRIRENLKYELAVSDDQWPMLVYAILEYSAVSLTVAASLRYFPENYDESVSAIPLFELSRLPPVTTSIPPDILPVN
jgi:hypothetical protein